MGAALSFDEHRPYNEILESLGITCKKTVRVGCQIWIFGCSGVPDSLPGYMAILEINPEELVGVVLSDDEAKEFS